MWWQCISVYFFICSATAKTVTSKRKGKPTSPMLIEWLELCKTVFVFCIFQLLFADCFFFFSVLGSCCAFLLYYYWSVVIVYQYFCVMDEMVTRFAFYNLLFIGRNAMISIPNPSSLIFGVHGKWKFASAVLIATDWSLVWQRVNCCNGCSVMRYAVFVSLSKTFYAMNHRDKRAWGLHASLLNIHLIKHFLMLTFGMLVWCHGSSAAVVV